MIKYNIFFENNSIIDWYSEQARIKQELQGLPFKNKIWDIQSERFIYRVALPIGERELYLTGMSRRESTNSRQVCIISGRGIFGTFDLKWEEPVTKLRREEGDQIPEMYQRKQNSIDSNHCYVFGSNIYRILHI